MVADSAADARHGATIISRRLSHRRAVVPIIRFALTAALGAGLLAAGWLHARAASEDLLFDQIAGLAVEPGMTQAETLQALTDTTHALVRPRLDFFSADGSGGPGGAVRRPRLIRSAEDDLIDGLGACGSHTAVLGRLLQRSEIPIRIVQMYCSDTATWGCHIVLEAKVDGAWRTADALYDVVYPASARELGAHWSAYRALTPDDYDPAYRYDDVRYTNWSKIPVVMPAAKAVLDRVAPRAAETLSLRAYVLNAWRMWVGAALMAAAGAAAGLTGLALWERRRTPPIW